jgi:type IV secretion system protein VirB10
MVDTPRDRYTVNPTPNLNDIERAAATERASKMPPIAGGVIDPKRLIGFAAVAGAVMFTVLALGSGFTGNSALPVAKPKPALEPERYDPNTVIAPTLAAAANDPNAPIPLNATQVPPIAGQSEQARSLSPAPPHQASSAQVLRESARRSSLIAYDGEREERATETSGVTSASDVGIASVIGRIPPHQPTNLETLRRASIVGQVQAHSIPDRNFLVTAGTFIPCVLESAMDSSQPGLVTCIIPRNIYSDNGRVVLMEKGTKVFGEYQAGLNRGQSRLFVLWDRAVTPRGIEIDVASPATDALGRSGADGRVNNFFWHRFGTALLFSLIEDVATVGGQVVADKGANSTRVPSDAASTILQQNAEIKPVLRKNQGEDVGITVAQDFDFSNVYGLALK